MVWPPITDCNYKGTKCVFVLSGILCSFYWKCVRIWILKFMAVHLRLSSWLMYLMLILMFVLKWKLECKKYSSKCQHMLWKTMYKRQYGIIQIFRSPMDKLMYSALSVICLIYTKIRNIQYMKVALYTLSYKRLQKSTMRITLKYFVWTIKESDTD